MNLDQFFWGVETWYDLHWKNITVLDIHSRRFFIWENNDGHLTPHKGVIH